MHWDKVKHLTPPAGLSVTEFWLAMKYARQASARTLPFVDEKHQPLTPALIFELHRILTENTLELGDADKAGAFRAAKDDICVFSREDDSYPSIFRRKQQSCQRG